MYRRRPHLVEAMSRSLAHGRRPEDDALRLPDRRFGHQLHALKIVCVLRVLGLLNSWNA